MRKTRRRPRAEWRRCRRRGDRERPGSSRRASTREQALAQAVAGGRALSPCQSAHELGKRVGAGGGIRTRTPSRASDFKSLGNAVPVLPRGVPSGPFDLSRRAFRRADGSAPDPASPEVWPHFGHMCPLSRTSLAARTKVLVGALRSAARTATLCRPARLQAGPTSCPEPPRGGAPYSAQITRTYPAFRTGTSGLSVTLTETA